MLKKILAATLALVMAMGMFAMNASAATDVIYGDVTGEGLINASDALEILQSSTGILDLTDYESAIGDVNADSKLNSSDALLVLQYATGLVTTFNKSYDKTLKAINVDPAFETGSYTFGIAMNDESVGDFDMVFSTDGKAKVISTTIIFKYGVLEFPIEVRMLYRDGKNYQVLPEIMALGSAVPGTGVYCYLDEDVEEMFDAYSRIFTSDVIFGSSVKKTVDGKEYVCETFYSEAGAKFEYYFSGNTLEIATVTNKGTTQTFDISNIEKGADTTKLVIPSHYTYDESLLK